MNDIAIRVENLSKLYRIGAKERQPQGLWQTAKSLAASPFEYLRRIGRPPTEDETLWALRDVSFEVKRGEAVGVIGRNGSGKSTLLKILSRITEPTSGRAEIHGRVGSLLEVGTGFHPELTGRENIYLNGAILGMKRAEIDRRFDAIVAFAEIERFLDTPVKRYSSGMYVRLAFAVAAHLEPEILLVDEVLAVGDAVFQKKCLGKMGDVAKEGRTVLFVSHNMSAITRLCGRAVVLSEGSISLDGNADVAVSHYLSTVQSPTVLSGDADSADRQQPYLGAKLRICSVHALPSNGRAFAWWEPLRFEIQARVFKHVEQAVFGVGIETVDGDRLATCLDLDALALPPLAAGDSVVVVVTLHSLGLAPGLYSLIVGASSGSQDLDRLPDILRFEIGEVRYDGSTVYDGRPGDGPICCLGKWEHRK